MGTETLYTRLSSALHHQGERRFRDNGLSVLITRKDLPYTLISVLVKDDSQSGSLTLELDAGQLQLHHPRNLKLVERALDRFCP